MTLGRFGEFGNSEETIDLEEVGRVLIRPTKIGNRMLLKLPKGDITLNVDLDPEEGKKEFYFRDDFLGCVDEQILSPHGMYLAEVSHDPNAAVGRVHGVLYARRDTKIFDSKNFEYARLF